MCTLCNANAARTFVHGPKHMHLHRRFRGLVCMSTIATTMFGGRFVRNSLLISGCGMEGISSLAFLLHSAPLRPSSIIGSNPFLSVMVGVGSKAPLSSWSCKDWETILLMAFWRMHWVPEFQPCIHLFHALQRVNVVMLFCSLFSSTRLCS